MRTEHDPIKFADGTYRFFLPMKQVLELERACGATDRDGILHTKSIYTMHEEMGQGLGLDEAGNPVYLGGGTAHPRDIKEVIRLALIGGGSGLVDGVEVEVGPLKAQQLCEDYVYPAQPLINGQFLAWSILEAAIRGVQVKKKELTPASESEGDLAADRSSRTADNSASTRRSSRSGSISKPSKRTTKP